MPDGILPFRILGGIAQDRGPCIVIASGPSQNFLKENKWNKYATISVNFSQKHFPSKLHAMQDTSFLNKGFRWIFEYKCLSVGFFPISMNIYKTGWYRDRVLGFYTHCTDRKKEKVPSLFNNIHSPVYHTNSVLCGSKTILLAYQLGFNPIITIGFDGNCGTNGEYEYGNNHPQFGIYNPTAKKLVTDQEEWFIKWRKRLNIINCSTNYFGEHILPKKLRKVLTNYKPNGKVMDEIIDVYLSCVNNKIRNKFLKRRELHYG